MWSCYCRLMWSCYGLYSMQTGVKISEIWDFYAREEKRTPKTVLQLYNCTWLHHELCQKLFANPRDCTRRAFFGIYLHSLAVHAPMQYELVCLRSVNTENQERIFQHAKQIARTTTNRQPGNVIPTLLQSHTLYKNHKLSKFLGDLIPDPLRACEALALPDYEHPWAYWKSSSQFTSPS